MLGAMPLHAATCDWSVASGDWSTASNWGGAVPGTYDTVYIANGGTANVTQAGANGFILNLGDGTGGGTVQMTAGNLASQDAYLGFANPGSFVQSGGTISPGGGISLYLAYNANSLGTYSLSG